MHLLSAYNTYHAASEVEYHPPLIRSNSQLMYLEQLKKKIVDTQMGLQSIGYSSSDGDW